MKGMGARAGSLILSWALFHASSAPAGHGWIQEAKSLRGVQGGVAGEELELAGGEPAKYVLRLRFFDAEGRAASKPRLSGEVTGADGSRRSPRRRFRHNEWEFIDLPSGTHWINVKVAGWLRKMQTVHLEEGEPMVDVPIFLEPDNGPNQDLEACVGKNGRTHTMFEPVGLDELVEIDVLEHPGSPSCGS